MPLIKEQARLHFLAEVRPTWNVSSSSFMWLRRARLTANGDRKSTRLNSSHEWSSYAVFCLKKKRERIQRPKKTVVAVIARVDPPPTQTCTSIGMNGIRLPAAAAGQPRRRGAEGHPPSQRQA